MKLFKFRPLGDATSFDYAKKILEIRRLWCTHFWHLNDPMEGVYSFTKADAVNVEEFFLNGKAKRVICSLSGWRAFSNPLMWCYYANGFKGMAIEVQVNGNEVKQIKYVNEVPRWSEMSEQDRTEQVLTMKLAPWSHEKEYRYIAVSDKPQSMSIGQITAVYFGDPYQHTVNHSQVHMKSDEICEFHRYRDELEKVAASLQKPIPCKRVCLSPDGKVVDSSRNDAAKST